MTSTTIEYVGCTEGRGISPTTKIEGTAAGDLRVVADASLKLAYEKTKQENTPVALEIVRHCLELARNSSSIPAADRTIAAEYQTRAEEARRQFEETMRSRTATVTLSTDTAKKGAQVTVSGTRFQPNEMVAIRVHATLVTQVTADPNGSFSTVITVPADAALPGFSTSVTASGQTSARSAQAPFRVAQ